jgi:hypothetical protein
LCWDVIGYFISLNTSWDLKNISLWIGYFVVVLRDFLGCVGGVIVLGYFAGCVGDRVLYFFKYFLGFKEYFFVDRVLCGCVGGFFGLCWGCYCIGVLGLSGTLFL